MTNRKLKDDILKLRSHGKTRDEIVTILNCRKNDVNYYFNINLKEKILARQRKYKTRLNYKISQKIQTFSRNKISGKKRQPSVSSVRKIQMKIQDFSKDVNTTVRFYNKPSFTVADLLHKIGDSPKCYLTGETIDIEDTKSWQLDHIMPRSRGGSNNLDNADICLSRVNSAKGNMTNEEFINMCQNVIKHQNARLCLAESL
jgi:5-methylcytosine-specific restriction endonuclease McrA